MCGGVRLLSALLPLQPPRLDAYDEQSLFTLHREAYSCPARAVGSNAHLALELECMYDRRNRLDTTYFFYHGHGLAQRDEPTFL